MSQYDDDEDRPPAKEVYQSVLGSLDNNTGGRQPPIHRQPPLRHMVNRGKWGYNPKRVKKAVEKAIQNGDVFRWEHPNGDVYLGLDDVEKLREKVASYAERREDPRTDLISVANQRIQYLKDNADV